MPKTKVIINGNDYSELVSNLVTSIEFDKDFLIGNAPSMELTLKANNKNGEFNGTLDSPFILRREDGTKLGTFYVVKKPERMTKEISLTLYDSMYKANIEYVSSLKYPTTIKDILDDMSSILDISIDYTEMNDYALNRVVNSYDSTEMIRSHLCWIAELAGGNFFADVDGKYVFKPLSKNKIHDLPPDDVEQFETIEDYLISGVMFTNDIVTIISGNEDNNMYRIDANNLYIDAQDDLDNIYSLLGGLTFVSSNALKCANIEGLQLGEIVNVADEFNIMPLSIKQTYLNATYDIQEISGEISTKNEEKKSDPSNITKRIRRVQAKIDQQENSITLLSNTVNSFEGRINDAELKVTSEAIVSTVRSSKEYINDLDKTVKKDDIVSCINQTAESILIQANRINLVGAVTAEDLKVDKLSSISANLGDIKGGSLNINNKFIVDSSGNATVDGKITARNGSIAGFTFDGDTMSATVTKSLDFNQSDLDTIKNIIMNGLTPTPAQMQRYNVSGDGYISSKDYVRIKNIINSGNKVTTTFRLKPNFINTYNNVPILEVSTDAFGKTTIDQLGYFSTTRGDFGSVYTDSLTSNGYTHIKNEIATLGHIRINEGWIGFHANTNEANGETNRKGWYGHNGGTSLSYVNEAGGYIQLNTNGAGIGFTCSYGMLYFDGSWRPQGSNTGAFNLGESYSKWKQLYATTATIATSDRNEKKDFIEFDERYEKLFFDLKPQLFKYKNGESNRFHSGFISQDVEESLKDNGLTALDFAGFCKDKKLIGKVNEEGIEEFTNVLDENGEQEYTYSLRYEEFIGLNTHMIQKQQIEIDELKKQVEELKSLLKIGGD